MPVVVQVIYPGGGLKPSVCRGCTFFFWRVLIYEGLGYQQRRIWMCFIVEYGLSNGEVFKRCKEQILGQTR